MEKSKAMKKITTIEGLAQLVQGEFLGVNQQFGKVERVCRC